MPRVPYPTEWTIAEGEVETDAARLAEVESLFLAAGGAAIAKHHADVTAKSASSSALQEAKSLLAKELLPQARALLEKAGDRVRGGVAQAMAALVAEDPAKLFTAEAAATMARAWCAVVERRMRKHGAIELNQWLLPVALSESPELLEMLTAARRPFGLEAEQASAIMKVIGERIAAKRAKMTLPGGIVVSHDGKGFRAERAGAARTMGE